MPTTFGGGGGGGPVDDDLTDNIFGLSLSFSFLADIAGQLNRHFHEADDKYTSINRSLTDQMRTTQALTQTLSKLGDGAGDVTKAFTNAAAAVANASKASGSGTGGVGSPSTNPILQAMQRAMMGQNPASSLAGMRTPGTAMPAPASGNNSAISGAVGMRLLNTSIRQLQMTTLTFATSLTTAVSQMAGPLTNVVRLFDPGLVFRFELAFRNLTAHMGQILRPVLERLLQITRGLSMLLNGLNPQAQRLVTGLAGVAAGMTAVGIAMNLISLASGGLVQVIGMIVGGVAGLAIGFGGLDKIMGPLKGAVEQIGGAFNQMAEVIEPVFEAIGAVVAGQITMALKSLASVAPMAASFGEALGTAFLTLFEALAPVLGIFQQINAAITGLLFEVLATVLKQLAFVVELLLVPLKPLIFVLDLIAKVFSTFTGLMSRFTAIAGDLTDVMMGLFDVVMQPMADAFARLSSMAERISGAIMRVADSAGNLATTLTRVMGGVLGRLIEMITGPLVAGITMALNFIDRLVRGFEMLAGRMEQFLNRVAAALGYEQEKMKLEYVRKDVLPASTGSIEGLGQQNRIAGLSQSERTQSPEEKAIKEEGEKTRGSLSGIERTVDRVAQTIYNLLDRAV